MSGASSAPPIATGPDRGCCRLRRRVQDQVDRRFDRSRYDAVRTVGSFQARLRDELDLDTISSELVRAVHQTVQPT
jgi:hypothetical protein